MIVLIEEGEQKKTADRTSFVQGMKGRWKNKEIDWDREEEGGESDEGRGCRKRNIHSKHDHKYLQSVCEESRRQQAQEPVVIRDSTRVFST